MSMIEMLYNPGAAETPPSNANDFEMELVGDSLIILGNNKAIVPAAETPRTCIPRVASGGAEAVRVAIPLAVLPANTLLETRLKVRARQQAVLTVFISCMAAVKVPKDPCSDIVVQ